MSSDHKLSSTCQLWNSLWFDPDDCSDLEQLEKMRVLIAWGNDKWATLSKDISYSSYVLLLTQTQKQINDHFLRLQMEKGNVEEWQMGIALFAVHAMHRVAAEEDSSIDERLGQVCGIYHIFLSQKILWKNFFTIWALVADCFEMFMWFDHDTHCEFIEGCIEDMLIP